MTDTKRSSRLTSSAAEILIWVCALTATAWLLHAYAILPSLEVFGHDEVHYYANMQFKLAEDGRWLDIFLHDYLRSVPLKVWAYLWFITCWLLFFRIARSLAFGTPYAVLVAATILLAPPFFAQCLWPASAMPALVIFLIASIFVKRGTPYPIVYIASGVLMFGAYQTYYLLLPLLFLNGFLSPSEEGERVWITLLKHMTWWVLGAIAGVLVMSTMLWISTDHFGVQPAEWRRIQPAHDLAGLLRNIQYVSHSFLANLLLLLIIAGVGSGMFGGSFIAAAVLHGKSILARRYALLLLIAVMASFFAMSVPMAPIIQPRSVLAMAAAIVLIVALMTGTSGPGRLLSSLMLLWISYHFSVNGSEYLAKHKADTGFFYHKLKELMPLDPADYKAVALYGDMSGTTAEAAIFNNVPKMHSIAMAIGVRDYRDCRQGQASEFCKTLAAGEPIATVACPPGQLTLSVTQQNIAVITYTE